MKCEDLEFDLTLYDDLTGDEQNVLNEHLAQCPPCRVRLTELRVLQSDLRLMRSPAAPAQLLSAVRSAVRNEVVSPRNNWLRISNENYQWLQFRVMPYTVGLAVSLFMALSFLISIDSTRESSEKVLETARLNSNRVVSNVPPQSDLPKLEYQISITNEELAALRIPVSGESPSLNTQGALLSVTKSLFNNKINDENVTFVADVFGDGLAQITEIVNAPNNQESLEKLSKALQEDPAYAPFVPADLDKRSNVVRVVFRIQTVDVFEEMPVEKKKPSEKKMPTRKR